MPSVLRPGARPRLLFDLTDSELVAAHTRYAPKTSLERLRSLLGGPFQAAQFGDLARAVGPAAAPKVLASLWEQARRGVEPDVLARHFTAEMERYADLWDAEQEAAGVEPALQGVPRLAAISVICGPAGTADSGAFRVKVNTTRVPALLLSYGSVRVDHYKKNSRGKYRDEKAARLEVTGTVFMDFGTPPVQAFSISKVETNEKKARASFTYAGLAQVPFVEGCGGVNANSPLWTCACSGNNPNGGDGGGGGFGGPGDGGIVDGG